MLSKTEIRIGTKDCNMCSLCFTIFHSVLTFFDLSYPSLLQGALTNERDYESVVMMKMRQAAERQKLIEQMQKEDEDEAAKS